jgi:uncharacterized membrane protein
MLHPRLRATLGLVLLWVLCSPVTLWRVQLESNLWIDETYSLLLTTFPVDRLVEVTSQDSHPPLYYLALKAWRRVVRSPLAPVRSLS